MDVSADRDADAPGPSTCAADRRPCAFDALCPTAARATIGVAALPRNALVEIEAVLVAPE